MCPPPPIIDLPPPLGFRTRIHISFLVKVLGDSLQFPTKYSGFRFNIGYFLSVIRITTKLAHSMFQVLRISKTYEFIIFFVSMAT